MTKLPHPDVRIIGTGGSASACFVHRDHLATVKAESGAGGAVGLRQRFLAYGEKVPVATGACAPESRGFPRSGRGQASASASTPTPG